MDNIISMNSTSTNSTHPPGVVSFWHRKDVKFYKLDFFFLLTALLIGKVLILRAIRYRKVWGFVSFLLLAAGYLSNPALSYVLGLLNDQEVVTNLTMMWAVFLVVLDGTADNTASLSLEGNEATRKRFLWDKVLPSLWLLWLLFFSLPTDTFWIPIILLWVLFILKLREKKMSLIYACRGRLGLDRVATVSVEYMRVESSTSVERDVKSTTSTMQDYRYLVGVKEALKQVISPVYPPHHKDALQPDKLVTIDEIWQCKGKLLDTKDTNGRLKDICLSFALFWRLLPRFADYDPPKESGEKAWMFVKDMLLNKDQDHDEKAYGRVFRVVEIELQFLRDYFYTTYFSVYRGGVRFLFLRVIVVAFYLQVSFITLKEINARKANSASWDDVDNLQLSITKAIIYTLILVEVAHIINMITSRWNKVKWVCSYVQNKWWDSRIGRVKEWLLCKLCHQPPFTPCFRRWHRKLRQYSLLESYKHTPIKLRFRWLLDGYMNLPMIGQKEIAPISLSKHVMEAIIKSLLHTKDQKLSNGLDSLHRNGLYEELNWACKSHEVTRIILVWHIATIMCEKESKKKGKDQGGKANFLVATSLSKYCAYLVAFVPKLLPDHEYMTQWIFEQAVTEARVEFKHKGLFKRLIIFIKRMICCGEDSLSLDKSLEEARDKGSLDEIENLVQMGGLLGKELKKLKDEDERWKVLADFWAELILFLAPSNQANEHAKHLVNGGEFITHLWVLLSHAGIVDRG